MGNIDAALMEQVMAPKDAEGAVQLSIEAGWNQTIDDWRFMLAHGRGLGVRGSEEQWIGSSVTLPLGDNLSWISMVLVARQYRRRGIGTRLLRRCIDAVRSSGAVAGLDATELGRPVYLRLGFRDLYSISRWRLSNRSGAAAPSADRLIRPVVPADLPSLVSFDTARSGMQREPVLRYLCAQSPQRAFVAESSGLIAGYVLGRPGHAAVQVGPVASENEELALALMRQAVAAAQAAVIIDVPDRHERVRSWLAAQGAVRQRGFTRMVLGEPPASLASPGALFALAGPELG